MDLMKKRRELIARLRKPIVPKEYQQLTYLEANGAQYINTGIKITPNTIYDIKYTPTTGTWIAGYTEGANGRWGLAYNPNTAVMTFYSDKTNCQMSIPVEYTEAVYDFGKGITYDGNTVQFPSTPTRTSAGTGYLFKAQNSTAASGGIVYAFTIYQNGVKAQDLIPCRRKADGTLGMYDLVTGNFLTNTGTGTFIAGKNI